jgi:hypothetical protein
MASSAPAIKNIATDLFILHFPFLLQTHFVGAIRRFTPRPRMASHE